MPDEAALRELARGARVEADQTTDPVTSERLREAARLYERLADRKSRRADELAENGGTEPD